MKEKKYITKETVLKRAQEAIGIPLGEIDKEKKLDTNKGGIGLVVEKEWFGIDPNSESRPDFPEAGVELKTTPYVKTSKGIRAKERLVCNIINYMEEYQNTFYTSNFWNKCKTLLIMSYEYKPNTPKCDFTIEKTILFEYPKEDLEIIKQDWEKIISKVRAGEAHLITEGDTLYLAACTKGADSSSVRQQPFSGIPAKQRAYSLKSSYMTQVLNNYVFGSKEDERVIKDWRILTNNSFESIIEKRLEPYYGKDVQTLANYFGLSNDAKNTNELLLSKMLGIDGRASKTVEFQNASIVPKTIRIQKSGTIKESMSFPTFRFTEIINEEWETSSLREILEPTKFMFVIFQEKSDGKYYFERVQFWNMPAEDLEEVKKVWEQTVKTIREGVKLEFDGHVTHNNLPKQSENRVAHVRPKARNASDTYPLPGGGEMTKQCFWLNRTYVKSIVTQKSHTPVAIYDYIPETVPMVAEKEDASIDKND